MSFYLDASVLVAAITDERHSPGARAWIKRELECSIISVFAATEVASALSRGLRTGRFTHENACAALDDLDALRAACEGYAPSREAFDLAEALVRDFTSKLAAPDALHLASAIEANVCLVTFDDRLAAAAIARGTDVVVPVLSD